MMDFSPVLRDFSAFSLASGIKIRNYQKDAADAIIDSVFHRRGLTFVIMFPRQSGKNEIQGQIENYILFMFALKGGNIIKVSPTWRPQSINAKQRLARILRDNDITKSFYKPSEGYQFVINDKTRISFLSGEENSNIVGNTADLLLEIDEAQDVGINKYDKEIAPMAASTNATRAFFGTAWTNTTLLSRELRIAKLKEQEDGIKRVFRLTCEDVWKEVPAYRLFVEEQVNKLGRNHPTIKTQYYCEEIDAESSFISAEDMLLMEGQHDKLDSPSDVGSYAMMIDIAGEEEENVVGIKLETNESQKRDATAITICEIDFSTLDTIKHAVTWRVVCRYNWTGVSMVEQYARMESLIKKWKPISVCCDGTGIGAGLSAFLKELVGEERFVNFIFTSETKSKIGWGWLAIVHTGRWKEYKDNDHLKSLFFEQLKYCKYEILPGVGKKMRFSVPDGTRNLDGEYVHDDLIMSAAMSAAIEAKLGDTWLSPADALIVEANDPYKDRNRRW